MKRTKRLLALALSLLLCFGLLAGCGGNSDQGKTNPTENPGKTDDNQSGTNFTEQGSLDVKGSDDENAEYQKELTVIIDNNKINSLDPAVGNTNTCKWAFNMMYDRLLTTQTDGTIIPELAEEYTTEDYQHFTFKLRQDVDFWNGEHFTADDVAFTLDRGRNDSLGTSAYDVWSGVESYNIVNDYTIEITLKNVNIDFPYNLTLAHAGIMNREAVEADKDKGPWVSTGPWKVVDFVSNDYATMERNEGYWGEVPKTEKITLKYVAEEATRLIMLENGEADAAFSINPSDFPYMEADSRFATYSYTVNNNSYIGFNMEDPICGDINFRMAVASVLNREEIVAYRGKYIVPGEYGTFWGYGTEFKDTSIEKIPYDVEAAKDYLAKSPYNGETIEIVCAFSDLLNMSQVMQAELAEIGINISINQTDAPGMNSYTAWDNNQAQMVCYTGAWTGVASSCRPYFYSKGAANRAHYVNPEVEALLDAAQAETDAAAREDLYKQVQAIIAVDIPYITLGNLTHVVGCLAGVSGMRLNADASHDLTYIVREI